VALRTLRVVGLWVLLAVGVWLVSTPSAQPGRAADKALQHFNANARAYGLTDPSAELRVRRERTDERGITHVKFHQLHRGAPVFEGEAIAHVDENDDVTVTNALAPFLNVDTTARIGRSEAVNTAVRFIAPLGAYQIRDVSPWILPRGARSVADRLTWHVAVMVENEFEDPAEWRYFIDARTGAVAFSFDALQTAKGGRGGGGGGGGGGGTAVIGTARTMYSGNQPVTVESQSATSFFLRDPTRGTGNFTCDMNDRQSTCTTFSRSTSVFGNNLLDNSDRATAGADAHFGLERTWEYYRTAFGRDGIDNNNRRTYSRVHYGRNYENAFWSDACFCMTYGDGRTTFYPLVSLDVAGHEMSHGVMTSEANLTYSGESGGLNESNSDIFGTLVEFYANAAPDVPDYWIGERIYRANYPGGVYTETNALRYMDDPHKDGISPACWSSTIGNLNVHYSSGPNNHMFYLLAHGGTSKCNGAAVTGIGNARAGAIWYRAITDYMTASTNYHGARAAALGAAAALYGAGSTEYNAVAAAYSAIGVN
jgi:Zn-dependent metalloprotease